MRDRAVVWLRGECAKGLRTPTGESSLVDHLSAGQIERYLSRTASPPEIGAILVHSDACPDCRERLSGGLDQVNNLVGAWESLLEPSSADIAEPYHLPPEMAAAYLSGHLDDVDLEIADSHLEDCEQCTNEMLELRALERLAPRPAAVSPSALGDREPNRLPRLRKVSLMKLGLAASWILIAILGVETFIQRKQVADLKARASSAQELESSLRAQSASISELQAELEGLRSANDNSNGSSTQNDIDLNDAAGLVKLDSRGALVGLGPLPAAYEGLVRAALTSGQVEISHAARELVGKRETLMGGRDTLNSFSLVSPVGEVVASRTPAFRWSPLPGATSYVVAIFDSNLNQVDASPPLPKPGWAAQKFLRRGAVYTWQVTAMKGANEIIISPGAGRSDAKFRVLDVTQYEELASAERTYKGSHLLMGLLYARAGLLDDARREFTALQKANPDSSVAKELLRSVRAARK